MTKRYNGVSRDENGKIFYQASLGTDPNTGKRVTRKGRTNKYGQPFRNEKEAYDEILRLKAEYNASKGKTSYNLTFTDYIDNVYLPAYALKVQQSTYDTALRHHNMFKERFGKYKLREIDKNICETYRLYLMKTYSKNYANNVWIRFKECMGYAERMDYIDTFPLGVLDNPPTEKPETDFWTFDEFKKVMTTFDLTNYQDRLRFTSVWLYYMTGVRRSEGLAIKWEDVDFSEKVLHVHRTLEYDKETKKFFAKNHTKTEAGMRFIELDDETLSILKNWKEVQVASDYDDFVLSPFGQPMAKTTIGRMIKSHANKAGVHSITPKGLRHSHASFLIVVQKKNILYVSRRLGHASTKTTLDTYSHWYHTGDSTIGAELTKTLNEAGLTGFYENILSSQDVANT